jgi:hypothetical protein
MLLIFQCGNNNWLISTTCVIYIYILSYKLTAFRPFMCYLLESWNPPTSGRSIQYLFFVDRCWSFVSSLLTGADSLCGRLSEKIKSKHGHRLVLAHMPLLMVCLEVGWYTVWIYKWNFSWNVAIGRLSEKVMYILGWLRAGYSRLGCGAIWFYWWILMLLRNKVWND